MTPFSLSSLLSHSERDGTTFTKSCALLKFSPRTHLIFEAADDDLELRPRVHEHLHHSRPVLVNSVKVTVNLWTWHRAVLHLDALVDLFLRINTTLKLLGKCLRSTFSAVTISALLRIFIMLEKLREVSHISMQRLPKKGQTSISDRYATLWIIATATVRMLENVYVTIHTFVFSSNYAVLIVLWEYFRRDFFIHGCAPKITTFITVSFYEQQSINAIYYATCM